LAIPVGLAGQDVGLPLGTKAPVVAVEDLDGKSVDLGQYLGKQPVLLEFWATWCPLCKALEPSLKAAHARYGGKVTFLAVGVGVNETPAPIKSHLAGAPLPGGAGSTPASRSLRRRLRGSPHNTRRWREL